MAAEMNQPLERVPTGIEKLDTILGSGFLRGGIYMVVGTPGAGKTILGNQISFNHVAGGGRVVFMTLLAETHARMLAHIKDLSFFDQTPIGDALYYVSGYSVLEQEGLSSLLKLIRTVLRERRATLLVLDGLATAEALAATDLSYRRFLHELQVYIESVGSTAILLTQPGSGISYPEHTMVDGVIELTDNLVGPRAVRELRVGKLRGSSYLRGKHVFDITDNGIEVYPRTEALLAKPRTESADDRTRLGFGVPRLDEMLMGGLLSGSTTTLLGAPGSGKTVLALHFLHKGLTSGERCQYFGFYETPRRLLAKARHLGLSLDQYVESGQLEIIWQPALEDIPDALVDQMLTGVRKNDAKRLVIDGLEPFDDSLIYRDRTGPFFTAVMTELRALNVTTLFSAELPELFSPRVAIPVHRVSSIVDNIIFLRYVELRSQLYRLISIMKMRESDYDPAIREFKISENGIDVASTFQSAEAILTGVARDVPVAPIMTSSQPGIVPPTFFGPEQ